MRIVINFVDRGESMVYFEIKIERDKDNTFYHSGMIKMTVKDYITFERALVLADAEMGKAFEVRINMPSYREEREKESKESEVK